MCVQDDKVYANTVPRPTSHKTHQVTWNACTPPMDLQHRQVAKIITESMLILFIFDTNHD